jgi:hypothetical protein
VLLNSFVKNWANLYAGAFCKLFTGLIGLLFLCNLIKPFICGGFEFNMFTCHFFVFWDYNIAFVDYVSYGYMILFCGVYIGLCKIIIVYEF